MSRLIKIRLGDVPFWFLNDKIKLSYDESESSYFDIDQLEDEHKRALINSLRVLEVKAFDIEGQRIADIDSFSNYTKAIEFFSDDDDDDEFPEILCVTVSENEEKESVVLPSEEDMENAKILLENKLGVIKNIIANTSSSVLLRAILDVEEQGKKRKQIISMLEEKL
jgi:hypothetical protein